MPLTFSLGRPVQFSLAPSRWHCVAVLVGVCIAGVAIVGSPLSVSIRLTLLAGLAAYALWECRRGLLRAPTAVRSFRLMVPTEAEAMPVETASAPTVVSLMQSVIARPHAATSALRITYSLDGHDRSGSILGSTVVTPQFVGIRYRLEADRWWQLWPARTLVVWPDAMSGDDFRRLRVLLRNA